MDSRSTLRDATQRPPTRAYTGNGKQHKTTPTTAQGSSAAYTSSAHMSSSGKVLLVLRRPVNFLEGGGGSFTVGLVWLLRKNRDTGSTHPGVDVTTKSKNNIATETLMTHDARQMARHVPALTLLLPGRSDRRLRPHKQSSRSHPAGRTAEQSRNIKKNGAKVQVEAPGREKAKENRCT